jgi:hypothetical protein
MNAASSATSAMLQRTASACDWLSTNPQDFLETGGDLGLSRGKVGGMLMRRGQIRAPAS